MGHQMDTLPQDHLEDGRGLLKIWKAPGQCMEDQVWQGAHEKTRKSLISVGQLQ